MAEDPYREIIEDLCADKIALAEFERRCKAVWVERNGPVPEGRVLVMGQADHRLVVGHIPKPMSAAWEFKSLDGCFE